MAKNITLRLDESLLKRAKQEAVERDQSMSEWIAHLIADALRRNGNAAAVRRRTIKALGKTFHLGGKPLTRDEIYAERTRLR